jgi:ABC-type lipoprotein export system ATPase subunit
VISLRNVERSYPLAGGQHYVLRRIDLEIPRGDFVSVMGPSGAGKTTLLAILGLLDMSWTGAYALDGHDVQKLSSSKRMDLHRSTIGFVFQQYHLLNDLTVAENLAMPLSYRNVSGSEVAAKVADTLDRFGIVGKKDLFPTQLSGGQQQLVGVARAVIHQPPLLLADEPTGNLHSSQGREIMELLKEINRAGTTIVLVTHSDENAAYGNRIIRLKDGWMESDGKG